jgi:hypothetical protein
VLAIAERRFTPIAEYSASAQKINFVQTEIPARTIVELTLAWSTLPTARGSRRIREDEQAQSLKRAVPDEG